MYGSLRMKVYRSWKSTTILNGIIKAKYTVLLEGRYEAVELLDQAFHEVIDY